MRGMAGRRGLDRAVQDRGRTWARRERALRAGTGQGQKAMAGQAGKGRGWAGQGRSFLSLELPNSLTLLGSGVASDHLELWQLYSPK